MNRRGDQVPGRWPSGRLRAAVCAALLAVAAASRRAPAAAPPAAPLPPPDLAGAGGAAAADPTLVALLARRDAAGFTELRERFAQAGNRLVKQEIAADLLAHGQGEPAHFDFLAGLARKVVDSDMPFPFAYDEDGKLTSRHAADFTGWCRERRLDPAAVAVDAVRVQPLDVLLLALASDRRAVDILVRGIRSPNPIVASYAAFGLARLHWQPAVPELIEVVQRLPRDGALAVAMKLALFDDPAAQSAAAKVIGDPAVFQALRAGAPRALTQTIGGD